tara:strand:+ start:63 stop:329 length:267 start_codon:yes stop_codon:yes gene_type:complete
MNDEASLQKEVSEGRDAEYLMDNPVFKQTFDYLKDAYFKAWEQTSVEDSKSRENVWMMYKTLDTVHGHIQTYVDTGKLAKKQLEEMGA